MTFKSWMFAINRYFLSPTLPLAVLYQCLVWVHAEVCPESSDTVSKLLSSASTVYRKSCPDFKDNADQGSCCPSSITPGTFYCCTAERRADIDAELAAEARRLFFRNYLAQIVIGSILCFVFLIILVSFVCKRVSFCPMYHVGTPSSQILSRYRPVDTIPPKPPSVYEAPPPYDFSAPRPSNMSQVQREHDWNCLIENEVNDVRSIERIS